MGGGIGGGGMGGIGGGGGGGGGGGNYGYLATHLYGESGRPAKMMRTQE